MKNMNRDIKKIINTTTVICFSAGQTSALMTKKVLEELECRPAFRNGIQCHISKFNRYVFVVFNNTGKEREESLQFVNECDKAWGFRTIWLEAQVNPIMGKGPKPKIVDFESADRKGIVFESLIKKHGIPNITNPKCTSVLKTDNTNAFIRQQNLSPCYQLVGIRIDEPNRLKFEKAEKENLIYPLATIWPTTKFEVIHFFNANSFRLMLKSYEGNCDDCYKKSLRKLLTLATENRTACNWWIEMGDKYGNYIPPSRISEKNKLPVTFYRDHRTMRDIVEMAAEGGFDLVVDETELKSYQYDPVLDDTEECGESCDAFTTA